MIRHLFFDIGGTLHTQHQTPEQDSEYIQRLLALLSEHEISHPFSPEELLLQIDAGAKCYKQFSDTHQIELPCDRIWIEFILNKLPNREILVGLGEHLSFQYDRWRKEIHPRPGLYATLRQLKESGYQMGIISNIMSRQFVPYFLEHYEIDSFFHTLILSSECGIRKPSPKLFSLALQDKQIPKEETCYIGDTLSRDVQGARSAHWPLILQIDNPLTYHRDEEARKLGLSPDFYLHSLSEIPAVLEQYNHLEVSP